MVTWSIPYVITERNRVKYKFDYFSYLDRDRPTLPNPTPVYLFSDEIRRRAVIKTYGLICAHKDGNEKSCLSNITPNLTIHRLHKKSKINVWILFITLGIVP